MKSKIFTLILLVSIFLNYSCSDEPEFIDPCEGVVCLNGGVCNDGTCDCPDGYYGVNCENEVDPCKGVRCLNGGSCDDGECDCPEGYDGEFCQYQLTPSKIRLSKIVVNEFNITEPSGGSWDNFSGADLYISILNDENEVLWTSSIYYEDATGTNYVFEPDPYIDFDEAENLYKIRLFDLDSFDSDDIIYTGRFYPYEEDGGFPSSITYSGDGTKFTIYLSYFW